jgi:hypothetical protein
MKAYTLKKKHLSRIDWPALYIRQKRKRDKLMQYRRDTIVLLDRECIGHKESRAASLPRRAEEVKE